MMLMRQMRMLMGLLARVMLLMMTMLMMRTGMTNTTARPGARHRASAELLKVDSVPFIT